MNRKKILQQVSDAILPMTFKTVRDACHEFVLFGSSQIEDGISYAVEDKTLFEAVENHVHFLQKIKKDEMPYLQKIAECICELLLCRLEASFPEKRFVVCAAIERGQSVTFRFHQQWQNEAEYYDDALETEEYIIVKMRSADKGTHS